MELWSSLWHNILILMSLGQSDTSIRQRHSKNLALSNKLEYVVSWIPVPTIFRLLTAREEMYSRLDDNLSGCTD